MDEADAFIKEACKHLDCSFADDEDVEMTTPQIFEFLVRCIWKIDSGSRAVLPSYVYPKVITTRLHLGNAISTYLQKLNIRGDIALHTVLYGNINNLRSAFIELIRKLPVDSQEKVDEEHESAFFNKVLSILNDEPQWVPVYCRGLNKKGHWFPANNQPELFPLGTTVKPSLQPDPRGWISEYLTASSSDERHLLIKSGKPALPPKPSFIKNKEHFPEEVDTQNVSEEVDESIILQKEYDEKLNEYRNLHQRRIEVEVANEQLISKLSQFDSELIEALDNPDAYAEMLLNKITTLNEQIESDTMKIQRNKEEAALKKQELAAELKKLGVHDEEMRNVTEMKFALTEIDEKIENSLILVQKLKNRIGKSEGVDNFYEYEKRSRDLEEMVRKQENDMIRMQEERLTLRKQEERENEAVNRSFAIIYNILLQHCESYRGRLAMESFTRIHLYCMEIMEMLRDNGALKQIVNSLESDIYIEEQKHYSKKSDLLIRDLQEVSTLNEELVTSIKKFHPNFKPSML